MGPPVIDETGIYFSCGDGDVYALDRSTGCELWRFATHNTLDTAPALSGGSLYFGGRGRVLYAVDAATGEELWRFGSEGRIETSPAAESGKVVFGDDAEVVYGLDVSTGQLAWQTESSSRVAAEPVISGDAVFLRKQNKEIVNLALDDGRLIRKLEPCSTSFDDPGLPPTQDRPVKDRFSGGPVAIGEVIVASIRGSLRAYDPATGDLRWHLPAGKLARVFPGCTGQYVCFKDGEDLVAVDPGSGVARWRLRLGSLFRLINVADGLVLVTRGRKLVIIDEQIGAIQNEFALGRSVLSGVAVTGDIIYAGANVYIDYKEGRKLDIRGYYEGWIHALDRRSADTDKSILYRGRAFTSSVRRIAVILLLSAAFIGLEYALDRLGYQDDVNRFLAGLYESIRNGLGL